MKHWSEILLKPEDSLQAAIEVLQTGGNRIVLVVSDDRKLLGTVTDGDIRRALINHYGMDALLSDIMFKEPTTALVVDNRRCNSITARFPCYQINTY